VAFNIVQLTTRRPRRASSRDSVVHWRLPCDGTLPNVKHWYISI